MAEFNGECPICGKFLTNWKYYCSEECVDISDGEAPRRSSLGYRDDREGWGGSSRAESGGSAHNSGNG